MRAFVSGCAGFLGSHICDELLSRGVEVKGIDSLIGGYTDNVPSGVDWVVADCLDYEGLCNLMKGCDLVVHTACTAYEGLSVFSPALITKNTYQISVNLMSAAIKNHVKRFVHCSSMARYGALNVEKYTEDMVCKPQDPYGIAKYAAELTLSNLAEVHGIELVIGVPHNIIGPRQKYDDPFRNVASIMANLMLQGRQPVIYGDGLQTRCFSDIEDTINSLVSLCFDKTAVGQIFNIGPDEQPVSIIQLAEKIASQLNFDLNPIFLEGRPQEVKHAICSSNKIRTYFDYKTKCTVDYTIEKLIDYIRTRGVKKFDYHLPIEIINEKTPKTWTQRLF